MKKSLSFFLSLMLIFSSALTSVYAEEEQTPAPESTPISEVEQGTDEITGEIAEEESEQLDEQPSDQSPEPEQVEQPVDETPEPTPEVPEADSMDEQQVETPTDVSDVLPIDEQVDGEEDSNESEEPEEPEEIDEDPYLVSTYRTSPGLYGNDESSFASGSGMRLMMAARKTVTSVPISGISLVHAAKFETHTKSIGIDVSYYQGSINWSQVKASGVDYAIIRVGYRGYGTGRIVEDSQFATNVRNATAAGLKVGLYFFSEATTTAEAIEEANFVLDRIKSYNITLPIYMDLEYIGNGEDRLYTSNLSKEAMTNNALAFCNTIKAAGYQAGVYANLSFLNNSINAATVAASNNIWLAHWPDTSSDNTRSTSYAGAYTMWQYGTAHVNGISGDVDANVMYIPASNTSNNSNNSSNSNGSTGGNTSQPSYNLNSLSYQTHVQNIGWQGKVNAKGTAGTTGRSLRLEAINITLPSGMTSQGNISYQTHVQNIGWQGAVSNGKTAGTSGQSLRMEAIKISLTGNLASQYDIYYRVHVQDIGWQAWKKNGEVAGTTGRSLRMEAIEIYIVKKGTTSNTSNTSSNTATVSSFTYQTHVQDVGWQAAVTSGKTAGTSGRSLRMEALKITLPSSMLSQGNIRVQAHVQDIGWQNAVSSGQIAGTSGRSLRMEAVKITLTGNLASKYDVFYRVHVQDNGWMNWCANGGLAGTTGASKRLEAIQIIICEKGSSSAPIKSGSGGVGNVTSGFVQYTPYFYSQLDGRWSNNIYGHRFGMTGCSPTAAAMVIRGILNNGVNPADVGGYLYNNTLEYNRAFVGTSGLGAKYAVEHWGLKTNPISNYNSLVSELMNGKIVIMCMNPGIFTSPGSTHAIVLWGYDNGTTNVYDPLGGAHNGKYSVSTIWSQRSTDKDDNKGGFVGIGVYK